jgi:hypothetical protein
MSGDREDIAGVMRDEARIARERFPKTGILVAVPPELLDRAADAIERLRREALMLRAAAGEHGDSVARAYEFASMACDLLGVGDAAMPWNADDPEGCWATFDRLNDRLAALAASGAAAAK